MKKILSILFSVFAIVVFSAISAPAGAAGSLVIGGLLYAKAITPTVPMTMSSLHNEVIRTLFLSDLQERLYPSNAFYSTAQADRDVDVDVESIEIPQDEDGEIPVLRNPKKFPLETIVEEDKKKTYTTTLLATPPHLVTLDNQLFVSYDKRAAKLRKHENTIRKEIAEIVLNGWAPSKSEFTRLTTSTSERASSLAGSTGDRKRIALEDWMWADEKMNELNIPAEGRRVVITPKQKSDLVLLGKDFINASELIERGLWEKGSVGMVLGFSIFMRSETQAYSADGNTKRAIGAAVLASDSAAAIFFHPAFVRYAEGNIKVYMDQLERGEMLGKTMNVSVRAGATHSRLSEIGALALVEDAAA